MRLAINRMARDTGIVMVLILVSRLLGFVRELAVVTVFGLTSETDAFQAAFRIPDFMFFLLVGGALNAAFVPIFTAYLARGEEEDAWRMASTFFNLTVLLLIIFTVLGVIFAPLFVPLVAYKFAGAQRQLFIYLTRFMFPAVFFTALAGLGMGVHRSYERFTVPLLGPIFYNIAITLGAYFLGPRLGIVGMAIGTVVGAIGNFLIQIPFLVRKGHARYRFHLDFKHPGMRQLLLRMLPAVVGLSIFQVNTVIATNLASTLQDAGSISALNLSNRLTQLPLGVFAMGLSMVLFPAMTRQAATAEMGQFRRTFSQGLRTLLFVTIPSGAGFIALGVPVVRLLFQVGRFNAQDTQATAYALSFFSIGLFAQSGIQLITRAFYSLQDAVTPVKVGVLNVLINTGLSLVFLNTTDLAQGGLALAFSISGIVQLVAYLMLLRRKIGFIDGTRLIRTFIKSTAASIVMAFLAWFTAQRLASVLNLATFSGRFLQVMAAVGVGALVYAALALVMKMDEVTMLREMVHKRVPSSGS